MKKEKFLDDNNIYKVTITSNDCLGVTNIILGPIEVRKSEVQFINIPKETEEGITYNLNCYDTKTRQFI